MYLYVDFEARVRNQNLAKDDVFKEFCKYFSKGYKGQVFFK